MDIVFATNNLHKLEEISAILDTRYKLLGLKDLDIREDIPEDFDTLEENASQKAWYIYDKTGLNCFADETGLEVDALDGAQGVYSARYSRLGELTFPQMEAAEGNIKKLLIQMENEDNRKARFRTVIALIMDGKEYQFTGMVMGEIMRSVHGSKGFGYDPVFKPDGYACSFAEMDLPEKNQISHRARAAQKLVQKLGDM